LIVFFVPIKNHTWDLGLTHAFCMFHNLPLVNIWKHTRIASDRQCVHHVYGLTSNVFSYIGALRLHAYLLILRTLSVHLASKPSYDIHQAPYGNLVYQQHRLLKSGSGLNTVFYSITYYPSALRAVHSR